MRKLFTYMLITSFAVSCEEPIAWEITPLSANVLITEGMLTNNPDLNYVRLSTPIQPDGSGPLPVSGAVIYISDGRDSTLFKEDLSSPGKYLSEVPVRGVVNRAYRLSIYINAKRFVALARMVPVTPIGIFRNSADNSRDGYYFITEPLSAGPAIIEYEVSWEDPENPGVRDTSVLRYYSLSTVDVNQFFKPAGTQHSFPASSVVIRRKYSLSPDYERFIRSLLSETEWKGGWFDVLPGNLHTNLSPGALGYFAACSVITDTVSFRE